MKLKLISIPQGFEQYKQAISNKDYKLIQIWQQNFNRLIIFLIYKAYNQFGLDYKKIFTYISTFIKFYQASEYISDEYIKQFLSSYWANLDCAEMLLSLR